jgi:hypothetical protein
MPSVLRSAAVFAAIFAVAVASMPGCSQQGEGERCDYAKNGNDDCDSGLVCIAARELLDQATDRCCLQNRAVNDKRCTAAGTTGTGTGTGGTGGTGAAGSDSAGMSRTPAGAPGAAGAPSSADVDAGAGAGG